MALRDRVRELRRVRAGDLRANPRNWRLHPKAQREAIAGVLAEIGYADALLAREVDGGDLELIDGHLRAETTPDATVPVLVLDLDDAEAAKLLATLDPLAALAEPDKGKLDSLLREIDTASEALQAMLTDLAKDAGLYGPEVAEDEVPEPPKDPVTKPGDLWLLGEHRLLCGDSTKAEDVGRVLDGRKPFLMVTDPPYGVEYDPTYRSDNRTGKVQNDDRASWLEAYSLFPGMVAYVWHAGWFVHVVANDLDAAQFERRSYILWKKPRFQMGRGHYHWQHEPCWYAARGPSKWCGDRTQSTVWEIDHVHKSHGTTDDGETNHGTQKPVECMARPIRNHGGKQDDVYDPFLGSGTTIIAAEQLGRRAYGLEISPGYCDVICERFEKLSGVKPLLART